MNVLDDSVNKKGKHLYIGLKVLKVSKSDRVLFLKTFCATCHQYEEADINGQVQMITENHT